MRPTRTLLWVWVGAALQTAGLAETFVLSAGVEQYDDGRISSLKYAVADAKSLAAAFRASGVPQDHVALLTSDQRIPQRRPQRINLIAELQRIRDLARAGDRVIVFFAGHGIEEDGEQYLLTVDARRDMLGDTALPMRLVNKALEGLQASEVLFIIDACRNAPDAGRGDEGAQLTEGLVRGVRPRIVVKPEAPKPKLVATLLSCDVGQRAYEDPQRGHGVFTLCLLAGLTGKAVGDDGLVHLGALADYVAREVKSWCLRSGKDQTPRLVNPDGGDMVILKPPSEPLVSIDARNSTLAQVVADIAEQVGAQVVFGAGVDPEAKVTGRLDLQPLSTALKVLLLAHKLTVRKEGEVYVIESPGAPAEPQPEQPQPVLPGLGAPPTGWPESIPWPPSTNPALQFRVRAKDGMPQVLIPAGRFLLGAPSGTGRPDAHPQRKVYISAFWMDLHPVTVAQYLRYCQATNLEMPRQPWFGWSEQDPMTMVTAAEAEAYAAWVGARLPTEAEYERAARAGSEGRKYGWGDSPTPPIGYGNLRDVSCQQHYPDWPDCLKAYDDGYAGASPVNAFPPNAFGLYDMLANVVCWTSDTYQADWYQKMPDRDPANSRAGPVRVARGCTWCEPINGASNSGGAEISCRHQHDPTTRIDLLGFRCVQSADTATAAADNPGGIEFVRIPAGDGLAAFELDKYEVTVAQFRAFVEATGYRTTAEQEGRSFGRIDAAGDQWDLVPGLNWRYGTELRSRPAENCPVVHVSQADARAFAAWAGGRLPTDAEWEHAARGGAPGRRYVWGDQWPPPTRIANLGEGYDDGFTDTAPVGSFPPTGFGLCDLAGNVWEWTDDRPNGCRGGGFNYYGPGLLSLAELGANANSSLASIGFRVARDAH